MSTQIYNVPKGNGESRDDYNRTVFAADVGKEAGWLTDEELEAKFPPQVVEPEPPTLEEVIADYEARIQARLDDFARSLTYDGIMSACTYATSGVDMYRIEGQYCVDARDDTWAKAYELLSAILPTVQAGGAIPAWEEIEAELPVLEWPEGSRGYGGASAA